MLFCDIYSREMLIQKVLHVLKEECTGLCSTTKPSLLRKASPEDLAEMDLSAVAVELKARSPLLFSVLTTIAGCDVTCSIDKIPHRTLSSLSVATGVLMHQRNMHVSAVQHSVGLILDFGGAKYRN